MFEKFRNTILWPLLGICLTAFGCILIFYQDDRTVPIGFVVGGLLMVSFDKAKEVVDFTVELLKKIKSIPKLDKPSDNNEVDEDSSVDRQGIINEDAPPPAPDEWNRLLRPVLYQASHYGVPTYYLNAKLQIIDWNVAF